MNPILLRPLLAAPLLLACALLSSCAVHEEVADASRPAAKPSISKPAEAKPGDAAPSWAERLEATRAEREQARAEAEKAQETEQRKALAEKQKEEAAAARLAAAEAKKAEKDRLAAEAEKRALAAREAEEREERLAERRRAAEERREARFAASSKAEEDRLARREQREREVAAVAERGIAAGGVGFFSRLSIAAPTSRAYRSPGHHVHVNQALLPTLNPANARVEISISEQRLRVYRTGPGPDELVIETQVSTGKPGHATSRGSYRISEMLVEKRSTLYGSWHNASGAEVPGSHRVSHRPRGASRFLGAEMPYWMRINGGIGIHVGFVPDGPASHGCIRVPEAVQPLIFSKVRVGTPVTVR